MASVLLSVWDLAKRFGSRPLFQGLRFGLFEGERIGLIGPNGAGKSTLLRILAGEEEADAGSVVRRKGLRLAYVPQDEDFPNAELSVRSCLEDVLGDLPLDEGSRSARLEAALSQAGFADPAQPLGRLSGGWRKRLSILRGVLREPELLLLDEPSNHLDLEGVLWLEALLEAQRFSFVVVTHDRRFLEQVCNRVMDLDPRHPGGLFSVDGSYSRFLEKREEQLVAGRQQEASLAKLVRMELEWLRRGPKARGTKQQARSDRALGLMHTLDDLRGRSAAGKTAELAFSATERQTRKLLELKGAVLERGGRRLCGPLDLVLRPGEALGLLGNNGSGKSSLLKLLAGELEPAEGCRKAAPQLRIVHFDQHREQLDPSWTLKRALSDGGDTVTVDGQTQHVAGYAARFLFGPEQLERPLARFSGGEKARVLIARLMRRSADVLLLDEPTNDLDLGSLRVLEQALVHFPGALVLVSHDRYLLERVCDRLLALDGNGHAEFYADLNQWQARRAELAAARAAAARPSAVAPRGSRRPGLSTRERQELAGMETSIAAAEAALAAAQARLADPAVASDAAELLRRHQAVEAARTAVDALFARWEALERKAREAALEKGGSAGGL
jgi:ATP-binding cassette subfamily F protein uup